MVSTVSGIDSVGPVGGDVRAIVGVHIGTGGLWCDYCGGW